MLFKYQHIWTSFLYRMAASVVIYCMSIKNISYLTAEVLLSLQTKVAQHGVLITLMCDGGQGQKHEMMRD